MQVCAKVARRSHKIAGPVNFCIQLQVCIGVMMGPLYNNDNVRRLNSLPWNGLAIRFAWSKCCRHLFRMVREQRPHIMR
jgi:hypothetical protein